MNRPRYVSPFITNARREVMLHKVPTDSAPLYEIPSFPMRRGLSPGTTLQAGMKQKFGLEVRPGATIAEDIRCPWIIINMSCRLIACTFEEVPEWLEEQRPDRQPEQREQQLTYVDLASAETRDRTVVYGGVATEVQRMIQNGEIQF